MIDNFEYTYLPEGKVIFCACDQVYFEIFFSKLYSSFTQNISEFNQLHIHLINPDINLPCYAYEVQRHEHGLCRVFVGLVGLQLHQQSDESLRDRKNSFE